MRGRIPIGAAGAAVALASAFPGGAGAATIAPLDPGARATLGPAGRLRDRVIPARSARARTAVVVGSAHAYRTSDGATVEVALSQSFADTAENRAGAQSFVDFLATRLHGAELGQLRMFIGTAAEVADACGGDTGVQACYVTGERRMFVPSTDPGGGRSPYTREYVVTHEYGHHIAAFRRNDPFSAVDWGPKYWASYELICAGVLQGVYFPGNQGAHYLDDPGEGWADSYAHLHYPSLPFQFNRGFAPDAGAFAAIRRDVLTPWNGPATRSIHRSLSSRRRATSTTVRVSLDGTVALALSGPRRANYDIQVLDGRNVVDQSRAAGSRDRVTGTVCRGHTGTTPFTVRIRRRTGSGPFTLRISWPG